MYVCDNVFQVMHAHKLYELIVEIVWEGVLRVGFKKIAARCV